MENVSYHIEHYIFYITIIDNYKIMNETFSFKREEIKNCLISISLFVLSL